MYMASVSALAVLCRSDRLHSGCIGWVTVRVIGRIHLALQHPYSLLKLSLKCSLEKKELEKDVVVKNTFGREQIIYHVLDVTLPLVRAHVSDLLSLQPQEHNLHDWVWICNPSGLSILQLGEDGENEVKLFIPLGRRWLTRQLQAHWFGGTCHVKPLMSPKNSFNEIKRWDSDLMLLQMLQLCFFLAKLAQIVYEFLADSAFTRSSATQIS